MTGPNAVTSPLDRQLALTRAREADLDPDAILALWYLRNVALLDDLDAYEYLLDEGVPNIDAFVLDPPIDSHPGTLTLVRAAAGPHQQQRIESFVDEFGSLSLNGNGSAPALPRVIADKLRPKRSRRGAPAPPPRLRLSFVTDQVLAAGTAAVRDQINQWDPEFLETYDRPSLEQIARAVEGPALVEAEIEINVDETELLESKLQNAKVAVCPVPATKIVQWPEIESRKLFDLNVRFGLKRNRVRDSLDLAIKNQGDHANFLAFHNGLTVLCRSAKRTPDGQRLKIEGLSVVNGAQTVIAFADNSSLLTDDLRVLVKFVEVEPSSPFAREVAIRSNTQNPVTSRNLRALDPRQLIIQQEFANWPPYRYETRPGAPPATGQVITNDYAAQLLCAVYNEQPWLAVKRDTLFGPVYRSIFRPGVGAPEVLLCHFIRKAVEDVRNDIPAEYRRSWALTALVAVYLVGQLLRTTTEFAELLDHPASKLRNEPQLRGLLQPLAVTAADVLTEHRNEMAARDDEIDDFKVDFKRETFLRGLAAQARRRFLSP